MIITVKLYNRHQKNMVQKNVRKSSIDKNVQNVIKVF